MKNILLGAFVFVFIVVGVSADSWAMGRRGSKGGSHHSGTDSGWHSGNSFNENSDYGHDGESDHHNDGNSDYNSGDSEHNNGNNDNHGNNNSEQGGFFGDSSSGNTGDEQFPLAPVPEPATLALMGMGLSGLFLKRKKV